MITTFTRSRSPIRWTRLKQRPGSNILCVIDNVVDHGLKLIRNLSPRSHITTISRKAFMVYDLLSVYPRTLD